MDKRFEWIEDKDLIILIPTEFGLPKDAITLKDLPALIKFLRENGAMVQEKKVFPDTEPGVLHLMIPKTNYFINVKTALWVVMGLLLDFFVTKGVASAALAAIGKVRGCFGKLVVEEGDVCIYHKLLEAQKSNQKLTANQIYHKLAGKECTEEFYCMYRDKETRRCVISSETVDENLKRLKEIGAATNRGKYWEAEL